ncbi:inhibitor of growth protein 1 homolog [Rhodamnia argentea]|uniref:Inhibitor of growth protein 1 homolog n=1 Tax=Rhodamnia argentea TaxID=178133 RepID=A0A8B8NXR4_9MYRT|nr:inhibitor of growth protein 1 homolog [Rhodamnia argentea]
MSMDRHRTPWQMKPNDARVVGKAESSGAGDLSFPRTFDDFSLLESGLRRRNRVSNMGGGNDNFKYRAKAGKSVDPQLLAVLEFFRELYARRRDLFKELFPKLHDEFAEFSKRLEDLLFREEKERLADRLRRSLSVGSPRTTSREIGGGDLPLKLERFKVRTVDLDDDDAPTAGGGGGGQGGGQGGKGGTKSSGGSKAK